MVVIDTIKLGISPMPTSKKARKVILRLVGEGTIYELGSGWGGLAIALSKKNRVIGYEKAYVPWCASKFLKTISRAKNFTLKRENFLKEDLSQADVIVCYLYPGAMRELELKFGKELKNGALVISNSFQIPGRTPEQTIKVGDFMQSEIYLYRYTS